MKTAIPLSLLLVIFGGCVRLDERGFNDAKLEGDLRNGQPIVVSSYTPFAWDRLYVFVPRNSRETIREEVGTNVPFPHLDGGGYCLLVFVWQGKITAAFEEPRSSVDFVNLYRQGGYRPNEARFKGARMDAGFSLVPHEPNQ